jgi:hypothetical protein
MRWTYVRKVHLIAAIRAGEITFDQACRRYDLSTEELLGWQRMLDRYGPEGLRVTRLMQYRRAEG